MTNYQRRGPGALRILISATAAMALLLAGCGEGTEVGSDELRNFEEQESDRLGATTTVAGEPAPDPGAPPPTQPPQTTTTRPPAPTTTARPAAPAYEIKIQPDSAGTHFEPRVAQVFAGTPVKWVNTDSQTRSVEFADQSFASGPIPPGGSATFTPNRAGQFNYSDGTRPYAQGTLRVAAR